MLTVIKRREVAHDQHQQEPVNLVNPVESLWVVTLHYGRHPLYSESTYMVQFTTKLEGAASRCYLVIDMVDRFDEILRELNVFGVITKPQLHKVIDYVMELKIHGVFQRTPSLLDLMEGRVNSDEGDELFGLVVESILNERESFPTISSDQYRHGESYGVILDTPQYIEKYGANVMGVTSDALLEILGLGSQGQKRLLEIARGWRDMGVLVHKTRQQRLQEAIKPNSSSRDVKRFYLFSIPELEQLECAEQN